MISRFIGFAALAALVGAGTSGHAAMAFKASDQHWQFEDMVDNDLQKEVCRAFTNQSDSTDPVTLEVIYPKDGSSLPQIRVATKIQAPQIAVQLDSKTSDAIFLLRAAANAGDDNVYWYAPLHFATLEKLIRNANTLTLVFNPKNQAQTVKVSLSGSTNALNEAAQCLGKVKEPTDFFMRLNQQKDNLAPDLGDHSVQFMYQATEAASAAYRAGADANAALAALQKPVATTLAKEATASKALNTANGVVTKAQAAVNTTQAQITDLTTRIPAEQADLASLKQQKPGADADLKAKLAIYTPLKKQMAPYDAKVAAAAKVTAAAQKAVNDNQNKAVADQNKIDADGVEKDKRSAEMPGLKKQADALYAKYSNLYDIYAAYDPEYEAQQILNSDFQYNNAKSNIDWDQSKLNSAQSDMDSAQRDLSSAQNDLNNCQSQQNADCSSQNFEVSNAESEVSRAQSEIDDVNRDISSNQSTMDQEVANARSQTYGEQSQLEANEEYAYSVYKKVADQYNYDKSRVAAIPGEITKLQAEIAALQAALPGLQQKLTAAQTAQASTQADHDAFAKSIGFDVAETNYNASKAADDAINAGIAKDTNLIPQMQADLKKAQKALPVEQKALTSDQAVAAKAQQGYDTIETQLTDYHTKAAPVQAEIDKQLLAFQNNRVIYQDLYNELDPQ